MKNSGINNSFRIDSFCKKAVILLLAVSLFCLVAPHQAEAAIAYDNASNDYGSPSLSWSHEVKGGSDRIVIVGTSCSNTGDSTANIATLTYDGTNLLPNEIRQDLKFDSESRSTAMYYLVNPPIGTRTVSVTFDSGAIRSAGGAISLTGVDTTNPVDADNGVAGGTGTTASVTVTTNTAGAWVVDTLIVRNPNGDITGTTVGADQTERWKQAAIQNSIHGAGSHEGPKTPAGDVIMSWSIASGSDGWSISAAAFKPAGAGGGTPTISSAANQSFIVDNATTAISDITITDDASSPTITADKDIRIRIPSGFNMIWDIGDSTPTITGTGSNHVDDTSVSFEDSNKTIVITVTSDFDAGDAITSPG